MHRTTKFCCEVLGLPLVKTIELPDGTQHFFFDMGAGNQLAYFYFPHGPKAQPGESAHRTPR